MAFLLEASIKSPNGNCEYNDRTQSENERKLSFGQQDRFLNSGSLDIPLYALSLFLHFSWAFSPRLATERSQEEPGARANITPRFGMLITGKATPYSSFFLALVMNRAFEGAHSRLGKRERFVVDEMRPREKFQSFQKKREKGGPFRLHLFFFFILPSSNAEAMKLLRNVCGTHADVTFAWGRAARGWLYSPDLTYDPLGNDHPSLFYPPFYFYPYIYLPYPYFPMLRAFQPPMDLRQSPYNLTQHSYTLAYILDGNNTRLYSFRPYPSISMDYRNERCCVIIRLILPRGLLLIHLYLFHFSDILYQYAIRCVMLYMLSKLCPIRSDISPSSQYPMILSLPRGCTLRDNPTRCEYEIIAILILFFRLKIPFWSDFWSTWICTILLFRDDWENSNSHDLKDFLPLLINFDCNKISEIIVFCTYRATRTRHVCWLDIF